MIEIQGPDWKNIELREIMMAIGDKVLEVVKDAVPQKHQTISCDTITVNSEVEFKVSFHHGGWIEAGEFPEMYGCEDTYKHRGEELTRDKHYSFEHPVYMHKDGKKRKLNITFKQN